MSFKIPFGGRAHAYTKEELATVQEAMQTAITLTQGKCQQDFQNKFCQMMGSPHAFALMNATAGLELAAQLCQFKNGDELIIPAHTFTSSAYPFVKKGAKLIWADIDLATRVVTADTIEKCITQKTKAIVVVHLYGYGADMPAIMSLAKKHNLLVIEDAAQAIGTEINGKKIGTFGDIGIFSFHSHKNITTLGEGGMITVRDPAFAKIIPMLRHNGHCNFEFEREFYWKPAMSNVDIPTLNGEILFPNNYCMGEIEAALGAKLLDRLDDINREKRERAIYFIDQLRKFPIIKFHREDSKRHNYHLLVAQIVESKRDQFILRMHKDFGIQCVVQYHPLYRYDFYKKLGFGEAHCPNTDLFYDNMVSFPFHHLLTDGEMTELLESTIKVLGNL